MSDKGKCAGVLGASPKEDRYSNKAVALLLEKGFDVVSVNPAGVDVQGMPSVKSLGEIDRLVDILTMYVNAGRSSGMSEDILALRPGKVIFNPGAENDELSAKLAENGIETENACTLVMLNTGQLTAQ
jgi:predicted CoA-binding protein